MTEDDDLLVLEVPGTPVPKGRPRLTRSGRAYTPSKTRSYESDIRVLGRQQMAGKTPYKGPLIVSVEAFFTPPTSWPKWKRERVTDEATAICHTVKPDIDNLGKIIDGLNGVVWMDDAQIDQLTIRKQYASVPKLRISVFHRTTEIHSKTAKKPRA